MLRAVTDSELRIGRLGGTEIALDLTGFVVAFGVAASTWTSVNRKGPGYALSAGLIAVLMFVGALVLHELAHLAAGRSRRARPAGVTFWGFGGWASGRAAQATDGGAALPAGSDPVPAGPGAEALVAVAGPIANALAGAALVLIARALPHGHVHHALEVWGRINLLLAMMNAVPAYRFDACDLVLAAVWRITGDRDRAWRIATRIGQAFGVVLAAAALVPHATLGIVSAIVVVFVGLWQTGSATSVLRRERPGTDPP
jgi:Zn-dependent protease